MSQDRAQRVVITGLGVLAPGARNLGAFAALLRAPRSAVAVVPKLEELGFTCQLAALPFETQAQLLECAEKDLTPEQLYGLDTHTLYGAIAAIECWRDAGFEFAAKGAAAGGRVDWDTGIFVGTRVPVEYSAKKAILKRIRAGDVRRLGSAVVEQTMLSAVTAQVSGLLGLGGEAHTSSSACTTGLEALVLGWQAVSEGRLKRAMVGGCDGLDSESGQYFLAPFDSAQYLARGFNAEPARASRPMSASARGYVPGGGAAFLCLESLESAQARGAQIYAELAGAALNRGHEVSEIGDCARLALGRAGVDAGEVDWVNGYLPGNPKVDARELQVLEDIFLAHGDLPLLNGTKSLIGHTTSAAGAIESVGVALQLRQGFMHGNLNSEDLAEGFAPYRSRIPQGMVEFGSKSVTVLKLSFAYGDINAAVVLRRYVMFDI